jgi:methylated-DNA-protein-cysteine methyltransferase-like protein
LSKVNFKNSGAYKMTFFEEVYNIVKKIPKGRVATYGQIARILGNPRKAKIVGWALHTNPYNDGMPCHRVVNSKGELSGCEAFGGFEQHKKMLEDEGIIFDNRGIINLQTYLWKPGNLC